MNSVGFFNHQRSGCFMYRIKRPMDVLRNNEIPVIQLGINEDIQGYDDIKSIQVYGIYPFSFSNVLTTLKNDNKKIIYDLDDALELVDTSNPFYHSVKRDGFSEREILQYADHITVSTQGIYDYVRPKTDKPITIIPNTYDPEDWKTIKPTKEGLRIGFAGSPTHLEDLIIVLPALIELQKNYPFTFIIFGFSTGDYHNWHRAFSLTCPTEGIPLLKEFDRLISQLNFQWVPSVDFALYPQVLTNLALDIGICPLKSTPFNDCRSASKAMEYTLGGTLALASDVIPYQNEQSSILVKDNEWYKTLELYIQNPELRDTIHAQHKNWIMDNKNVNTQFPILKDIYEV